MNFLDHQMARVSLLGFPPFFSSGLFAGLYRVLVSSSCFLTSLALGGLWTMKRVCSLMNRLEHFTTTLLCAKPVLIAADT